MPGGLAGEAKVGGCQGPVPVPSSCSGNWEEGGAFLPSGLCFLISSLPAVKNVQDPASRGFHLQLCEHRQVACPLWASEGS